MLNTDQHNPGVKQKMAIEDGTVDYWVVKQNHEKLVLIIKSILV